MNVSDFTMCESKVREAAETGTLIDLRVGDPAIDSPEKGIEWGPERSVRAEVIADLLIGNGEAASVPVKGVRIQGARITGERVACPGHSRTAAPDPRRPPARRGIQWLG